MLRSEVEELSLAAASDLAANGTIRHLHRDELSREDDSSLLDETHADRGGVEQNGPDDGLAGLGWTDRGEVVSQPSLLHEDRGRPHIQRAGLADLLGGLGDSLLSMDTVRGLDALDAAFMAKKSEPKRDLGDYAHLVEKLGLPDLGDLGDLDDSDDDEDDDGDLDDELDLPDDDASED